MSWECNPEEVNEFLNTLQHIPINEPNSLYIVKQNKAEDKTHIFMIQYGITETQIREELLKLDISNYSYTDNDTDPRFASEQIWVFGQMFDNMIEVYIKIKVRRRKVICLSFHEKEWDLHYPYL